LLFLSFLSSSFLRVVSQLSQTPLCPTPSPPEGLFASPNGESEKAWGVTMITNSKFSHDEDYDFTQDFIASIEQDYITLFIYNKGQGFDRETAGKKASRAIAELYPYNFADKTTYRTYQSDNGKTYFEGRVLSR
jgi:hypothetical protein